MAQAPTAMTMRGGGTASYVFLRASRMLAVTGPASVVEAVAHGERAAAGIDHWLTGADHAFWRSWEEVDTAFDQDADPSSAPRAPQRLLAVEKRRGVFEEVELGLGRSEALREARRKGATVLGVRLFLDEALRRGWTSFQP